MNTPAMALKTPGVGSQYAYTEQDASGNYLDGAKNYRLHIPANVPAKNFWSVVPTTRRPARNSRPPSLFRARTTSGDPLVANADGSVDIYFGPKAPQARRATGSSRFRARAGTRSCVSMARWSRGSTRPGGRVKSKK